MVDGLRYPHELTRTTLRSDTLEFERWKLELELGTEKLDTEHAVWTERGLLGHLVHTGGFGDRTANI